MAPNTKDPVEVLFNSLPPPELFINDRCATRPWQGPSRQLQACVVRFLNQCRLLKSASTSFIDPDTDYLFTAFQASISDPQFDGVSFDRVFIYTVAELVLKEGRGPNDVVGASKKSEYMRLAAWFVRGRRDHENPFAAAAASPETRTSIPSSYYSSLIINTTKQLQQKCADCGKADNELLRCTGCLVDEDWAYLEVVYCSKECQKAHWAKHKPVCIDRKRLARAVAIVGCLSEQFQKRTFDYQYENIEARDGMVLLKEFAEHHELPDWTMLPEVFKGSFVFRDPPQQVRGAGSTDSEDYYKAIYHRCRCIEHTLIEWIFVRELLKPICKSITELNVMPKNVSIAVCNVSPHGIKDSVAIEYQHQAIYAVLHSGEKFVIDLSGAQYGWHEKLSLAQDFITSRSARLRGNNPIGSEKASEDTARSQFPRNCIESMGNKLKHEIAARIAIAVRGYLKEFLRGRLDVLLGGPSISSKSIVTKTQFDWHLNRLQTMTGLVMTANFSGYMAKGLYRLYLTRQEKVRVTETAEEAQVYEKVWLTEEEWNPIRDQPGALLELWRAKLKTSGCKDSNNLGIAVTKGRNARGGEFQILTLPDM